MAITATRMGSAPITFDWSGIQRNHSPDPETLIEAWTSLKSRFNAQDVGFYDSPWNNDISQATQSQELAESLLKKNQFTDCLFLGIGGSALGPISLLSSLKEKCHSGIRFHFMENPDPTDWKSTLHLLRPETTLVCIVTKSGITFETVAQALLSFEWMRKERWKTHLVIISDPIRGDLKEFATQEGIPTLAIAPSVGGRFSIFTPVGLFAAALAGLSVQDFLLGAKQVRDYTEKTPIEKNPVFVLAHHLTQHYPKRPIHICMPYSTRLRQFGSWFTQLWGESLGKNGKGFTPVAAQGATDQHSLLQLLKDGPDDKVTFFITVDQVEDEVKIPRAPQSVERKVFPAFRILEGHSLHELMVIEYRATAMVLTKQNRPHFTVRLDRLDERSLGALYFAFSTLAAYTGTLWDVNPFDQPGVEESKIYIRQALNPDPTPLYEDPDTTALARLRRI